jgi:hypothetical protein
MIIIIHLMFLVLTQKNQENHNFVGTIGNTIYKEWGSSFATGYDVLIILGLCRYSVNYRVLEAKQMALM